MRSLRARLAVLWAMLLVAAGALALLLVQLYEQSSTAQTWRAQAVLGQICEAIANNYSLYSAGWAGPGSGKLADDTEFRRDLATIVRQAMASQVTASEATTIRAGIWQASAGILAGELPEIARPTLEELATAALDDNASTQAQRTLPAAGLVLRACPLPGPVPDLAGWASAQVSAAPGTVALRAGLGVLLALVLLSTIWLTIVIAGYGRRVAAIERALRMPVAGRVPLLQATGMEDLDRIVAALNIMSQRLAQAQGEAVALAAQIATSARLAALGRVAAGVAHELRNPMAAMRLKVENALAGDANRRTAALEAVLPQIARLDRLVAELLAMTSPRQPHPHPVQLVSFLHACVAELDNAAISLHAPDATIMLDPDILGRAISNLLRNAVQHTPPGGTISLVAQHRDDWLRIEVRDTGPGVAPALRDTLFEPFVTGRADGTGLGLAIAREMAEAHGGRLTLANTPTGACFILEVPWRAS
jgi:signal transduction histidine kinase